MAIKVLLADDSITIQKVIGIIFGGTDYKLTVVDNGTSAVEKAREQLPDVLLIDLNMPGLNGYQTCEAIRAIPALAAKPILLLIGSFEPFDEEKARISGADDFIAKPFESQLILNKVNDLYAAAAASTPLLSADDQAAFPDSIDFSSPAKPDAALGIDDIWSAFTSVTDDSEEVQASMAIATDAGIFPDFGLDEADKTENTADTLQDKTPAASQWDDLNLDSLETVTAATDDLSNALAVDSPFDENAFDFSYRETDQPSNGQIVPAAEESSPVAAPPALTEEQLKAAISAVSKDVIERIVWEVVPDLAESIIKETIRRIREGK